MTRTPITSESVVPPSNAKRRSLVFLPHRHSSTMAQRGHFIPGRYSRCYLLIAVMIAAGGAVAWAQSSSLYLDQAPPRVKRTANGVVDHLSPHVSGVSISAVRLPEPRQFAVHDLITVIVRESIENESDAELETEKSVSLQGIISAFPNLQLSDLADFQLKPSRFNDGTPQLDLSLDSEFEGEGEYERKDTFTTRITSRIIDIKPNGTLVLEARKFIRSDDESVNVVMTGTCRKNDITADNTILSTQIYDLRLIKEHKGELRNSTKKGWITKFFDAIFNF